MSNFKEIVTKAVVGKGRKTTTNDYSINPSSTPSTILGCWIINHNYTGEKEDDSVKVVGSFDTNIWYSTDNNTKTEVAKDKVTYEEHIPIKKSDDYDDQDEIIVRAIKQPSCIKAEIKDNSIEYTVEKTLAAEVVGDTKIRVGVDEINEQDPLEEEISDEIKEDFIK